MFVSYERYYLPGSAHSVLIVGARRYRMLDRPGIAVNQVAVLVKILLIMLNYLAFLIDFELLLDFFGAAPEVLFLRNLLQPLHHIKVRHLKHSDHSFEIFELLFQFLNQLLVPHQVLLPAWILPNQ